MQSTIRTSIIRTASWLVTALILAGAAAGCSKQAKIGKYLNDAEKFYAAGDYDKAEVQYINVLRLDRTNGLAFSRLGAMYFDDSRLSRAFPFLLRGYQLNTNDVDLRLKLGQFYLAAGKPKEAHDLALGVLTSRPGDLDAPLLLAESSISLKELEQTRKYLQGLKSPPANQAAVLLALGSLDYRLEDFKAAQAKFEKARALDPDFGPIHGALATQYATQGNLKKADEEYKLSVKTAPYRSQRRLRYAQFKLSHGDLEGAKFILRETITNAPGYLPALLALADIDAGEQKYADANELIGKILSRDQNNYDALFLSGRLGIIQGDYAKAVTQFERMSKIYPKTPAILYQLALAYTTVGETANAMTTLSEAISIKPNFYEGLLMLAQLKLGNAETSSAIVTLKQLIQYNPKSLQGQILLGDAYRQQGSIDDAIEIYRRLEREYPTNPEPPMLLGSTLLQLNRRPEARVELTKSVAINPGFMNAVELLNDMDVAEKNYAAPMERLQKVMTLDPKAPEPYLLVAKLYMGENNPPKAVETLLQTTKAHPDYVPAMLMLGRIYDETGQYQKAIDLLHDMLGRFPQEQNGWQLLGSIEVKVKDTPAAREAYERLVAISPNGPVGLNNLGCIYADLNQLDKAYELVRKARDLAPTDAAIADSLGWVVFKQGDYAQAETLAQESASKLPGSPEVQFHAGMAHYMMGNEDLARPALQFAAGSTNSFEDKEMATNSLAILAIDPNSTSPKDREILEKRLAHMPKDLAAINRLAFMDLKAGKTDKAIELLETGLKLNPKNLKATLELAQLYAARPADSEKAYATAKVAYKLAPDDSAVLRLMSRQAYAQKDHQFALNLLQQIDRSQPRDAELKYELAHAYYSVGQIADAQAAMQSALAINPGFKHADDAKSWLSLVALSSSPSAAAAGSAQVAQALKSDPNSAPALMAEGFAKEQKPDVAGAEADFEKVIAQYPLFVPAKRELAILYSRQPGPNDQKAHDYAVKALDALPDDAELSKALGILSYRVGDYNRSAKLLKEYVSNNNNDALASYYLGMSQYQLKMRAETKKNLNRALELKLPDNLAAEAKNALAELK